LNLSIFKPTNRDLARRDITQGLQSSVSTLRLDIAPFYYSNGASKDLLRLKGTVVCRYQGGQYNIPVDIWLQQDHPTVPPLVYVTPTADMQVSPKSLDVRPDGTVIIPYLRNWRHVNEWYRCCFFHVPWISLQPNSDLHHLLAAMSDAFSQSPPVYSAPAQASRPAPYPTTATSMPMPTGYGMGASASTSYSYPHGYPNTQIPHDVYRDSLQAAVLNKVRDRLDETMQMANAQTESLRKTEQDLNSGEKKLETLIRDARQQQTQAEVVNFVLRL
jgi:ESCRT-I complex subunit TSG101